MEIDQTPLVPIVQPGVLQMRTMYEFTVPAGENYLVGAVTHHFEWPETKVRTHASESYWYKRRDLVTVGLDSSIHVFKGEVGLFPSAPALPDGHAEVTTLLIPGGVSDTLQPLSDLIETVRALLFGDIDVES